MQSNMQNRMKTGLAALFMSLFMFSASGAAIAGNGVQADPATEAAPNASQDESALIPKPAKGSKHYSKPKRLPKGDLRHCLELKDSAAIIRCTETGRKNGR